MDPIGIDVRRAADVGAARQTLDEARSRLDTAVAGMPLVDGDETMATPELLLLLVGAVRAKERLDALEALATLVGGRK
jgi:hypothetical protein